MLSNEIPRGEFWYLTASNSGLSFQIGNNQLHKQPVHVYSVQTPQGLARAAGRGIQRLTSSTGMEKSESVLPPLYSWCGLTALGRATL